MAAATMIVVRFLISASPVERQAQPEQARRPAQGGVVLGQVDIVLPQVLQSPINMFAASASPVVLISLGIFISKKIQFNKNLIHSAFISLYKLILLPIIFIFLLQFLNLSRTDVSISVLEAAMPLAITPFAMAEIYPLDKEIISMAVIISTMLSLFTLIAVSLIIN